MDLETHLLETLRRRRAGQGLTHGELREQCGPAWRRELAGRAGQPGEEASLKMVKDFVHRLWLEGRVVIEPPSGDGKAVRVWHPSAAASMSGARRGESIPPPDEAERIAQAYERLARDGRSPYVFLSHLGREAEVSLEVLHAFLEREQQAGRAVLSTGDWAAATAEEQAAALLVGGRHCIKARLVQEKGTNGDHGQED